MARPAPLSAAQQRALSRIAALPLAREVYLAGGTAIAVHLGHRRSVDLDLFSRAADLDLDAAQRALVEGVGARVVSRTEATLRTVVGGVPVDLVRYPYTTLVRPRAMGEQSRPAAASTRGEVTPLAVAAPRDLCAMKLAAVARRGLRRDFWDLHALYTETRLTLAGSLADYVTKFAVAEPDVYHLRRALTWFADAEADPVLPRGLTARHWTSIRAWLEREVGRLG